MGKNEPGAGEGLSFHIFNETIRIAPAPLCLALTLKNRE